MVQNIENYDLEDQKHIIKILKLSFNTENLHLIPYIAKALELLLQTISNFSCKQEEFLKHLEREFSDLLNHDTLFLIEQKDVCQTLVNAVQNALENSAKVDHNEQDKVLVEPSEEISEEVKPKILPRPPIPKVEHDGRRYYEIKEEFKKINTHLSKDFIEQKLFKKLDKQFEKYERSYKSSSNVYSCLEVLDSDNKDLSTNPVVRIKNIDEYTEKDIQGWSEAIKRERIAGKSLKQLKEETARRNITLINKHYLQSHQSTSDGKPERRENFDDDSKDGASDDDPWQKSEIKSFERYDSQETLQEENEQEDSGVVLTDDPEFLGEMLAVIKQAHRLDCGQILRDVQILATLLFFYDPDKGALLEIKTGEGKSTISAIKSVIWYLKGEKLVFLPVQSL